MQSFYLVVALLFLLMLLRMPVAFAMGASAVVGLVLHFGPDPALAILERAVFEKTSSFILVAIPLFILMAELLTAGNMTRRAIIACQAWVGHLRGGLAVATVGSAVMLAALVGSSTASAATMAASAFPEMRRYRYDDRLSSAVVCVGGTLAVMIPPSIVLVVYGILTETSIGRLFIAGIVPGMLTAAGMIMTIMILSRVSGYAPAGSPFQLRSAFKESRGVWPIVVLIILVIAAIYTGAASPTEAGALGVTGALILGLSQRVLSPGNISSGLSRAVTTTVMIVAIIFCSSIFANYLAFTQITQGVIVAVENSGLPSWAILLLMVGMLLLLGMVLDQLAILSLTMPLAFPIASALGYDAVWFGIIVTKTVEIGLLTPPLGLNVYVTAGQTKLPLSTVFVGILPFILLEVLVLSILLLFPGLTLWLPNMMW
ncbi:TRAP transporter large permease [Halomonas sp. Bachu 37]|uniref:TRAP transporter large permease n=1 Tax=Halomonas kashgarensis TaxID=3084920 RepID=UPI003217FD63